MASKSSLIRALEVSKPYIAMISLQFGFAGMNIITKVSLNGGMSHYVLVVYRHAFATAVMAPFALILERKVRPRITFSLFCQMFALGLLGPVIDVNCYYAGLKFTTTTFGCAMSNTLPAMTFIIAALVRMEKLKIKELRSQAKIMGTVLSVGGAMLMTLYRGPMVQMHHNENHSSSSSPSANDKDWTKGSILLILASLSWAGFFVLQGAVCRKYVAHMSLTTIVCFLGTLQSIAVTLAVEDKPSVWKLGWNMDLLAAVYAGVVTSAIAYYVQGYVMETRGPVFATAFSPLMLIMVAIMGAIILSESVYLGSILGGVLVVAGLYAVLWGKAKDPKKNTRITEINGDRDGEGEDEDVSTCKKVVKEEIECNPFCARCPQINPKATAMATHITDGSVVVPITSY